MVSSPSLLLAGRSETIKRLQDSLADVLYAVSITPERWHYLRPSHQPGLDWLGGWSVAENVAHLAVYEEQIAAPILEGIAAGRDDATEVDSVLESDYEALWQTLAQAPLIVIADRLSIARSRQVDAIARMDDQRFQIISTTLWRDDLDEDGHSAAWVATKTFQHTWEHGNSILRIALFAPR